MPGRRRDSSGDFLEALGRLYTDANNQTPPVSRYRFCTRNYLQYRAARGPGRLYGGHTRRRRPRLMPGSRRGSSGDFLEALGRLYTDTGRPSRHQSLTAFLYQKLQRP